MSNQKPTAAVYRRRRLVALAALIVVIALIWWLVAAIAGAVSGDSADETPTSTPTAAVAAPPATTAAPAETAAAEPAPTDAATEAAPTETPAAPEEVPACTAADVTVTAKADMEFYGPLNEPQFSFHLANTSGKPCTLDVGTAAQEFKVTSGSDTIWVSSHCQVDPVNQVVQLDAVAETDSPVVGWVRERSTPDTCEGERPSAVAGGAYYHLTVTVGGISSSPLTFVLE